MQALGKGWLSVSSWVSFCLAAQSPPCFLVPWLGLFSKAGRKEPQVWACLGLMVANGEPQLSGHPSGVKEPLPFGGRLANWPCRDRLVHRLDTLASNPISAWPQPLRSLPYNVSHFTPGSVSSGTLTPIG